MKRAESFIAFAIILIFGALSFNIASLYKRVSHSPEEIKLIFFWVLIGGLAGAILSAFRLWQIKRQSFKNVLACTIMVSFIFFGWGFVDFQKTRERSVLEAENWPQTQATITGIDIYEAPPTKTRNPSGRWAPVWNYVFSMGNQTIRSYSTSAPFIHTMDFQPTPEKAKARGKERPEGGTVTIRYNPKNPDETVLDLRPRDGTQSQFFFGIGIIIILIGSVGLYAVVGKIRQK